MYFFWSILVSFGIFYFLLDTLIRNWNLALLTLQVKVENRTWKVDVSFFQLLSCGFKNQCSNVLIVQEFFMVSILPSVVSGCQYLKIFHISTKEGFMFLQGFLFL